MGMKHCGKILTLIAKFGRDISRKLILLNVCYIGVLVTYQRYVCMQNMIFSVAFFSQLYH